MDLLLLGIYSFFVWLIFIKFKWLPWNTTSQVTVVIIPIVALATMILTLNVVAPSTNDVRVMKYVVQIVPQVRGRVLEVPVEPNRLVKKGELLFRIDSTPYQNDLDVAKAKLAVDDAKLAQASAALADAFHRMAGAGETVGEQRKRCGIREFDRPLQQLRIRFGWRLRVTPGPCVGAEVVMVATRREEQRPGVVPDSGVEAEGVRKEGGRCCEVRDVQVDVSHDRAGRHTGPCRRSGGALEPW